MRNRRLVVILVSIAVLLLLPYVAMQFTGQVIWSPFDFLVAGALLLGAGLTFEFFVRRRSSPAYRLAIGLAIAAVLALVWVELAVGVFGTPLAGS
jgi:hypothetical protein